MKTAVYRIIQESLTNVARYDAVNEVWVSLGEINSKIYLQVKDLGRGFDLSEVSKKASVGIRGMQERAAVLGGILTIISNPGAGTVVMAKIPIDVTIVESVQSI